MRVEVSDPRLPWALGNLLGEDGQRERETGLPRMKERSGKRKTGKKG